MENEIKNLKDLKNKTIVEIKKNSGDLWLKFSDNTFAILIANNITKGFGYTEYEVCLNKYGVKETNSTLLKLGLISESAYKLACEEEELESQRRQKEREFKENERIKKYELDQLEKLKLKYS